MLPGPLTSPSAAACHNAAMRWLITIFIALVIITSLQPWLQKLGIGRLPGDIRFKLRGREVLLPFTSTVLLSLVALLIGRFI
jgi:hypothetical protein